MLNKPKWRSDKDRTDYERDILFYGNAFTHVANINGELILRRIDPSEFLKPLADDGVTG